MGLLEIAITAVGLTIAFVTYRTNRRSTQIAEDTAKSDSMKRLKAEESLARQRAELARQRRIETEAKPAWPEVSPPATSIDRNVVGRDGDVATLRASLTGKGAAAITPGTSGGVVVKGRGGMGKTTLARYYIQTHRAAYYGIWWLQAQTRTGVIEDLAKLARWVKVAQTDADDTTNAENALAYLQQQKDPWLLVYDNAEHIDDFRDLLPERDNIHILLTSREGNWPAPFAEQPADALPEAEAISLLYQESGRSADAEGAKAQATALVHALDRLPLAIVAAGAWLRDVQETSESFADYQTRLAERIAEKPDGVTDYPDSVFGAVKLSLDKLSHNAALLMKIFCWLSPDEIWPGLVTGLQNADPNGERSSPVPDELWTLARDGAAVDKAFAELKARSLMDREGQDHWRLHRLTQAVQCGVLRVMPPAVSGFAEGQATFTGDNEGLRETPAFAGVTGKDAGVTGNSEACHPLEDGDLSAPERDTPAETYRRIAAAMLAASYPGGANNPQHRENWPICARLDAHVATLAENPPATAAMDYLLNQASVYLDAQRMDDRALEYAEASLRLKEARLGKDHEEVGTACNNLAVRYWRLGRMPEAEAMAARTIEIETDHPNISEASFAIFLSTHGIMAEMVGRDLTGTEQREKLDLAEKRKTQALEISERLHGRQSREVAMDLNNLAELHAWQGKWDQAIDLHAEALSIRREVFDADDPLLATSLTNLAATLLQSGRARQGHNWQGVLDLLEEAVKTMFDAFQREDHADLRTTASFLASAHWTLLALEAEGADAAEAEGVTPRLDRGVSGGGDHPDEPGDDGIAAGDDGIAAGDEGTAAGDDGIAAGEDGVAMGDDGQSVRPDSARALELCQTYDLDPEERKARAEMFVRHARLHEAGQDVPGPMQLQDMARQAVGD